MTSRRWILEWDLPHIRLLLAELKTDSWELCGWTTLTLPEGLTRPQVSGAEVAAWITKEGPEWIRASVDGPQDVPLIVSLPRDRVTIRKLELPPIPDAELPGVVPLQMASQLTSQSQGAVIDFLPPARVEGEQKVSVFSAAVPGDPWKKLFACIARLSTSVSFVGCSSTSLVELASILSAASFTSDQATAIIVCLPHRTESILVRQGQILDANLRRRDPAKNLTTRDVLGDFQRLCAQEGESNVGQLQLLLASNVDKSRFKTELSGALNCPLEILDVSDSSHFSIADSLEPAREEAAELMDYHLVNLGALIATATPKYQQLNFAQPRKIVERPDRTRLRNLSIGLGALGLLVAAYFAWWAQLRGLESDLERVRSETAEIEKFIRDQKETQEAAKTLSEYTVRSFEPTSHFETIVKALPDERQLLLQSWLSVPMTGEFQTRITMTGLADQRRRIEQFSETLAKAGWIVRSPTIRPVESSGSQFAYDFDMEVVLPLNPVSTAETKSSSTVKKVSGG